MTTICFSLRRIIFNYVIGFPLGLYTIHKSSVVHIGSLKLMCQLKTIECLARLNTIYVIHEFFILLVMIISYLRLKVSLTVHGLIHALYISPMYYAISHLTFMMY